MRFGDLSSVLVSRPVLVRWAGWETDTWKLQQAGWDISMDQDVQRMEMRMVVRNQEHGLIGQTGSIGMRMLYMEHHGETFLDYPQEVWQMRHMGRSIYTNDISGYVNFRAVDCKPRLEMMTQSRSLEELVPFASAPMITTQALILPEATVDDLLAGILSRQADAKQAYFKDLVNEERLMPRYKTHAQIISLAA